MLWDSSYFPLQDWFNPHNKRNITMIFKWRLLRFSGWDRLNKSFENYFTPLQGEFEGDAFIQCCTLLRGIFGESWFASQQVSVTFWIILTLYHFIPRKLFLSTSPMNDVFRSAPSCRSDPCTTTPTPCLLITCVSSLSVRGKYNFCFLPKCSSCRQDKMK